MVNFKFDLTDEQACLLGRILETEFVRQATCYRVSKDLDKTSLFEKSFNTFTDLACLCDEFNIQYSEYLVSISKVK